MLIAPSAAPNANGQDTEQNTNNAASELTGATEEAAAQINKAAETISQVTAELGATAVNAMHHDVIASGELPTELPPGITPEMVSAVAQGYVAQANTVLQETGVTVDALTSFLNENELRDARQAVFTSNDDRLKELAGRAKARLVTLPNDPTLFSEWTSGPDWDGVTITRENGETFVKTAKWKMSWAQAVNTGKIYF